jgi:hypothetical protein
MDVNTPLKMVLIGIDPTPHVIHWLFWVFFISLHQIRVFGKILFWVFFIARNIASVESLTGKERNWYVKTDCNELLRFDPMKSSRNFVVHK